MLRKTDTPMAQTVRVVAETPRGGLYFDGAQKQIGLAAGQRGVVDFYVQAMKRPFIGRPRQWPFVRHVTALAEPGPPTPAPPRSELRTKPSPMYTLGHAPSTSSGDHRCQPS